ncbi:AfsR/SARP family transcriptional regulator [Streptomyces sp. NPDC050617]|uniref:AfsR/SARP family transcriptional regulator n=1 Tax=Streptomyces sp. NPDC050617 TaxID=3154628 RepID=UPI003434B585
MGVLQARTSHTTFRIRGGFQRVLIQALLVSEGRVVPVDSLVREIWNDRAPEGVANALQAHVSRLRRWLQALEPGSDGSRLVGYPNGYQLVMDGVGLDAADFVAAVRKAATLKGEQPAQAAGLLRAVLGLWHGPVFGGSHGGPLCQAAAARYEEYRLQALELLFDVQMDTGEHAQILGELHEVCTSNPLREKFCQQLMVALYRSGRQAEALNVYQQMRRRLADELGLEPSPPLRTVERAILGHDPALQNLRYLRLREHAAKAFSG